MPMIFRPRPGTHVRIIEGSLENLTGTVMAMAREQKRPGKVLIKIDSPDTWSGERHVRVHWRKLRRVSGRGVPPHPQSRQSTSKRA